MLLGFPLILGQMKLIADSGSSKTDWKWVETGESFQTSGYNPYVQGMDALLKCLGEELVPQLQGKALREIYFYGSGFSHPDYIQGLQQWLVANTTAERAEVEHDLLGAARAICLDQPGIAVILGTGSNSCHFDGRNIVSHRGGHGYLFGDEGSGADLGKRLVKGILDQDFSETLSQKILELLECTNPIELRNRIHGKPKPNVALASLAPVVLELSENPEVEALILNSFRAFCANTLLKYPEIRLLSPGFTGSISRYFQPWLLQVLAENGMEPSVFVDRPINRLVLYHERFR